MQKYLKFSVDEQTDSQRNFGLDIARSLAISMVLLFHLFSGLPFIRKTNIFNLIIPFGSVIGEFGVELFFVLSGFLIGNILINKLVLENNDKINLIEFYKRRWFRTLPLYYFTILFVLIIHNFNLGSSIGKNFSWLNLCFLQFFSYDSFHFYIITWSLAVEEWFYLIFPGVFIFTKKIFRQNKSENFLKYILIFILIVYVLKLTYLSKPLFDNVETLYIPFLRLDSIAIGVLFAYINMFNQKLFNILSNKTLLFVAILTLLSIAIYYVYKNINWLYDFNVQVFFSLVISICFGIIISFLKNIKAKSVNFITETSKISYSLYLFHLLCYKVVGSFVMPWFLVFVWIIFPELAINMQFIMVFIAGSFIALLLSWIVCTFIYKYIEKPITNIRNFKFENNKTNSLC